MTEASQSESSTSPRTFASGYVFGAPVGDLSLLVSLIMSGAVGFAAFFAATFFAIFGVMVYNSTGHHAVDFAVTYRDFGLPVGVVVLVLVLIYMGRLWVRRVLRRA